MARKKLIPTWVKAAAIAALFVPYKVDIDKDEDKKLKKVTASSVAVRLSYSPAKDGKGGDISAVIPGITAGKCKVKAGGKTYSVNGEQIVENAKQVYEEVACKVKSFAKKASDKVVSVAEEPVEAEDLDIEILEGIEEDIASAPAEDKEEAAVFNE